MRHSPGRNQNHLEQQTRTKRASDQVRVNHLGNRAWLARAVAQQDPAKIAMIKAVTSMFARSRTAPGSRG
jgi:hypothetical protein